MASTATLEDLYDADNADNIPLKFNVQIQNIVATVNLNIPLDLEKISSSAKNAEYNPRRFQAVIMRIREPKSTALVFATGKVCPVLLECFVA